MAAPMASDPAPPETATLTPMALAVGTAVSSAVSLTSPRVVVVSVPAWVTKASTVSLTMFVEFAPAPAAETPTPPLPPTATAPPTHKASVVADSVAESVRSCPTALRVEPSA